MDTVKKTVFESLSKKLLEYEEEISDYELRRIVFSMFKRVLGYEVYWADSDIHGKNRILLQTETEEIIVNITSLMDSLRKIHKEYTNYLDSKFFEEKKKTQDFEI